MWLHPVEVWWNPASRLWCVGPDRHNVENVGRNSIGLYEDLIAHCRSFGYRREVKIEFKDGRVVELVIP